MRQHGESEPPVTAGQGQRHAKGDPGSPCALSISTPHRRTHAIASVHYGWKADIRSQVVGRLCVNFGWSTTKHSYARVAAKLKKPASASL